MLKRTRRMSALVLSLVLMIGLLAGCSTEGGIFGGPSNSASGSNTVVIRCNEGGFGVQWLYALAEAFEDAYKQEGYKVKLDIIAGSQGALNEQQIKLGPEKNDTDIYITGEFNVPSVMQFSFKVMKDENTPLLEPLDDIYYAPAIGADKQPEEKTIAERFFPGFAEANIYQSNDQWNGKVFTMVPFVNSTGIAANPAVFKRYGLELPNTTDELIAAAQTIAQKGKADNVYPYVWAGNNASSYWLYLWEVLFAQYSGISGYQNFLMCNPESGDMINDGWQVYEDPGILESLKVMDALLNLNYSADGAVNFTHTEAQHYLAVGEAGFMVTGDWLLEEMEQDYYDEVSGCVMLKTPVLSAIGTECGINDAQLSQAVDMVDAGKTNAEMVAAISGLTEEGAARIRDARNIYPSIGAAVNCMIPAYSDAKDVAKLFLQFMYSEDGCRIVREEGSALMPVSCDNYNVENPTTFMDSVVKLMNNGKSTAIFETYHSAMLRTKSGLAFFNYGTYGASVFRSMIMNEEYTAQYIYETEKQFVKESWANYIAYAGLS